LINFCHLSEDHESGRIQQLLGAVVVYIRPKLIFDGHCITDRSHLLIRPSTG